MDPDPAEQLHCMPAPKIQIQLHLTEISIEQGKASPTISNHANIELEPVGSSGDTGTYTTKMSVWPYRLWVLRQLMTASELFEPGSE